MILYEILSTLQTNRCYTAKLNTCNIA